MRRRVLVVVYGEVRENMAGPAIRGWEVSKALASRHAVTAIAPRAPECERDGVRLVPFSRHRLVREALHHDVVIAPELPPYLLMALRSRRTIRVADQFDPVELEHATLGDDRAVTRHVTTQRAMRALQLRFADVVVAANEPQRERTLQQLAHLGIGGDAGPRVVTVPFGLTDPPPHATERPLRERFGLASDDIVVLWWGSIWRWLDADTALRAFARVAATRPRVRFVLCAAAAPTARADEFAMAEEARALAADLDLLDRSVFFLSDWVPYERRHAVLQDADVGMVLHRDSPEAVIAARSRYLDYLWCGLPCVLARGDQLAGRMGEAGVATLVPPRDVDAAAAALARLVDDGAARAHARRSAAALVAEYHWSALVQPLACESEPRRVARGRATALAAAVGDYYGRRLTDRALAARARTLTFAHAIPPAES